MKKPPPTAPEQLLGVTLCRVDVFVDAPMFVGWIHADARPVELAEAMRAAQKIERKLGSNDGFIVAVRIRVEAHRLTRVGDDGSLSLETLQPETLVCLWAVGTRRVDCCLPNLRVSIPYAQPKQRGRKPKSARRVRLLAKVAS
jgi:hypothetical protein